MYIETIGEWVGICGLLALYVWIKIWIYQREYKDESEKDI